MRVAFAGCVFDTARRELKRDGKPAHLSPKAFQFLEALLERRPRAISKADLRDLLWPEVVVADTSLGRVLVEVRAAIGDEARASRLIRTVHGFGYAFCGTVTSLQDSASPENLSFRLIWGAREIALPEGASVLGRTPECAVWIDAPGVSRRHARVTVSETAALLEDLGSKNGTYLRGRRIRGPERLGDGDEVSLGSVVMTVRLFRDTASTRTEPVG